jgi:2-octaprenylphenol hydroxylase
MTSQIIKTDVAVVGAGLVGLSAALAMHQLELKVTLIAAEQASDSVFEADEWDQRIYAISPQNMHWLKHLGVWQHLNPARVTAVQAMQIWGDASAEALKLDADQVNANAMAYILEERVLREAMLQELKAQDVHIEYGVAQSFSMQNQQAVLSLDSGLSIQSDLLLAADGAHSWLRQQANIAVTEKDYQQTAIVANFDIEVIHADIARQWFRQEQSGCDAGTHCGILAWLPLPGRRVSIVWSAPTAYAQQLMQLDDAAFAEQVRLAGNAELGEMKLITARAAFPLYLKKATVLAQDALVLLGDAAHRIHPMAGQGVNLGFRDVIALAAVLKQRNRYQTLHDPSLLKQYTRNRKADVMEMTALTNGLYHLFDSENTLLQKVRNWGLRQTNQRVLKKVLAERAIAL